MLTTQTNKYIYLKKHVSTEALTTGRMISSGSNRPPAKVTIYQKILIQHHKFKLLTVMVNTLKMTDDN
jgi:hypothetical protein